MTAWAYLAVSSGPQADTLEDQKQWAQSTAAANGWEITRFFGDDRRGVGTGKHGVRKLLEDLLTELEATPKTQRPQRVLLIRLDRVGRLALDSIAILARIRKLGVTLHTRQDGDVPLDGALDALRPILELVTAEIENDGRRDKTRAAHARFRAEGKHFGPAPYGMTKDADKRLIPLEPQATFVRRAFELRATGAGYIRIAAVVGRDAPSQGIYAGRPRAGTWHRHTVDSMLHCQSYRGIVVPEELFDRVQLVKNFDFKQRMTQRFPWPLQGLIRCWCGWTLSGMAGGVSSKPRYRYYHCNHPRAHHNAGEKRPTVRADAMEAQFVEQLRELEANPDAIVAMQSRTPSVDVAALRDALRIDRAQLEVVDRRRQAAYDLQADGKLPADDLALRLTELGAEREELLARIQRAERTVTMAIAEGTVARDARAVIAQAAELWSEAPVERQKEVARLLAAAVGGIYLSRDLALVLGPPEGAETMQFHVEHSIR